MMELSVGCFNLVIEGLLVSSAEDAKKYVHDKLKFQSRNRGTFGFKVGQIAGILEAAVFQSRNRDAFGFKLTLRMPTSNSKKSFNLVIEMLLVSSQVPEFQSRNQVLLVSSDTRDLQI